MNKQAKYNLTWIFIGLAIFLTVVTISYNVYDTYNSARDCLYDVDRFNTNTHQTFDAISCTCICRHD